MRTDRIHQQAGVGVRSVEGGQGASTIVSRRTGIELVVGVGITVLQKKIVEREIELVFANVVGKRV